MSIRAKEHIINVMYGNQISSSKRRGHSLPLYTKKELIAWCLSQEKFHELYDDWIESGCDRYMVPSVDRIIDSKSYFFGNIQLMTWKENSDKYCKSIRDGGTIHKAKPHKPVLQFDKQGGFIAEFVSTREASRKTGVYQQNISSVCNSKLKSAGGFIWKFKVND